MICLVTSNLPSKLHLTTVTAAGIVLIKGRILNFVVQYETKIGDIWYPVVRYDTAHGFFHRDLMRPGKSVLKTRLYENDLNKALTRSEADIKERWQSYKAIFLKEFEKHES
jgi:hypothetical protein